MTCCRTRGGSPDSTCAPRRTSSGGRTVGRTSERSMKFAAARMVVAASIAVAFALSASRAPARAGDATRPKEKAAVPARQRVRDAKSYYCYYGAGRAKELSRYDVVILHTPAATPELVKELKG